MQHTKFKNFRGIKQQALMVQTVDSAIHWINHCLVDKYQGNQYIIQWIDIYLEQLVSDVLASSDFLLNPRRNSHHISPNSFNT